MDTAPAPCPHSPRRPSIKSWSTSAALHVALLLGLACTVASVPFALQQADPILVSFTDDETEGLSDELRSERTMADRSEVIEVMEESQEVQEFNDSAAPVAVETSDHGLEHAPKNNLMNKMGSTTGRGFEGRGEAARRTMVAATGGVAAPREQSGGIAPQESATAAALRWLAANQQSDGSWRDAEGQPSQAATGMALLAFMSAGQTHREGKYRDTMARGLAWISPGEQGTPAKAAGERAIAAEALAEAYGLTQDAALAAPARRALEAMQLEEGAASYGWHVAALKSAHLASLELPQGSVPAVQAKLSQLAPPATGPNSPDQSQQWAIAAACHSWLGGRSGDSAFDRRLTQLAQWGPSDTDPLYNYFATQVLFSSQSDAWTAWNQRMRPKLIASRAVDGSWPAPVGARGLEASTVWRTALNTMTLSTYHRHMPLYRRGTGGDDFEGAGPPAIDLTRPMEPRVVRSWRRSQLAPNASRLLVGDKEELPLEGMQVKVDIHGFRARVVLDCYFLNPHPRQLEGNFQLRLPGEASPFLFAFGQTSYRATAGSRELAFLSSDDVRGIQGDYESLISVRNPSWQGPKEARVVPRDLAAHSYSETVKRRVDPALVEWSGAGVFNCRVFPLMAGQLHRVMIGYDVDLLRVGQDWEYRLDLPVLAPPREKAPGAAAALPLASRCVVDVSVSGEASETEPVVDLLPVGSARRPLGERATGRIHYRVLDPQSDAISVRIPARESPLLAGNDATGPYWAASFEPRLPADDGRLPAAASQPAVFLVDVSLSSQPEKFAVWLSLMREILERNRGSLDEFAVLFFNIESHWWKPRFTANTPENIEGLIADCEALALEGATDLGQALSEAAQPNWLLKPAKYDLFLLSDAAATWGEDDPRILAARLGARGAGDPAANVGRLFAYSTGLAGSDLRMAGAQAQATGGGVFSVVGEAEVPRAAVAHRREPWRIESVEVAGTSDCQLAGRPSHLFAGQRLLLAGRGTPTSDEVLLRVRRGDRQETLRTRLASAIRSPLAARIYGQVALGQLEEWRGETQTESAAYARHFRIPGETCSLVMLESEEDYRRFGIENAATQGAKDADIVRRFPVAAVLAKLAESVRQAMASPRGAFQATLARLRALPGGPVAISSELDKLVAALPESAFAPPPSRIERRERGLAGQPKEYRRAVAARKLDWEVTGAECRRRLKAGGPHDALVALSSLIEEHPGEEALSRAVAFSALEWGADGAAYGLLTRLAKTRPEAPHSYLALARAAEQAKRHDLALLWYEVALGEGWENRFGDHARVAALDALRFLRSSRERLHPAAQAMARERERTLARRESLTEADLVVIIEWNTERTTWTCT